MTPDLSTYDSIACALLVRITCTKYRTTASGEYTTEVLKFNDSGYVISIDFGTGTPEEYKGLGRLVSISSSRNELRNSSNEVTIAISGIPDSSIAEIMNSKLKGSQVEIFRVLINPQTGEVLNIAGNPAGRFYGLVTNFSLEETYDEVARLSTNTIGLVCTSHLGWLSQRIQGRRTNPYDQEAYFPGDKSFSKVPSLIGVTYNWGRAPDA